MNIKKIKTGISLLLSFTVAFSSMGTNLTAYAAKDNASVQAEHTEKTLITETVSIKSDFNNLSLRAIDKEGNTYYCAFDQAKNYTQSVPFYTVKANVKGEVVKTVKGSCDEIKIIGDKVYVLQEGGKDENNKLLKGITCRVYDTDLNLLKTYSLPYSSRIQFSDINSEKFCYLRGNKIYMRDLDGENQKLLLDLSEGELKDMLCSGVAVTEDYAGVTMRKYDDSGDLITYAVAVNLKTGKSEINKQPLLEIPEALGDKIIWGSCSDDNGSLFDSSKQLVIWGSNGFEIVKTTTKREALNRTAIDSDGRIIAQGYNTDNDEAWFKIYKDGKPTATITSPHLPAKIQAENGVIAYSYTEVINGRFYARAELIPY